VSYLVLLARFLSLTFLGPAVDHVPRTEVAMPNATSARIHATAVISPEAILAEDVQVGPFAVIEGAVRIGPGCIIRPHALVCGPLTMGCHNLVFSGAVLGERPQHLKYNGEATGLEIGDHNVFRENVTIHRGTTHSWTTRIGSHNFFMGNAHVAHDCRVGDYCILANGALLGGHCAVDNNVYLSGNCAIHQFVRVGRLALLSGCSATTKDIPPFVIQQNIDTVVGVNVVGMRRAGITNDRINAVRRAFHILFREGLIVPNALTRIEEQLGGVDEVAEMVAFIRQSTRGINPMRDRHPDRRDSHDAAA
jgi:UDP-N-acetylglucosamine acyltransferase